MATLKTVNLGSLAPGINNKLPPTQFGTALSDRTKATFVSAADNVDINARGYVQRRRGFTPELTAADAHSLWGDGPEGFVVVGTQLLRLTGQGDGLTSEVLSSAMAPGRRVSFARFPTGDVYFSNGIAIGRISDGFLRPASEPTPSPVPTVTVGAGSLPAGQYLVAFTRFDPLNGESAASPVQAVTVPEGGGGLYFAGGGLRAYVSGPNGDILTLAGMNLLGLATLSNTGARCATLNLRPMPAGSIVRHFNGSMLVARDRMLAVSEPYYYGLFNPLKNYIPFPAPITVVQPTRGGVYVCADKTYWFTDLTGASPVGEPKPYGGIPGTGGTTDDEDRAFWQSPRGLMVGNAAGEVTAVQERALKFSDAAGGASLYRERDGLTQVIASRSDVQPNVAASRSSMTARIIRKGTVL